MQIKRQDLEAWYSELGKAYEMCCRPSRTRIRNRINPVWAAIGQKLRDASQDPVDVVPVQDYPFPWREW